MKLSDVWPNNAIIVKMAAYSQPRRNGDLVCHSPILKRNDSHAKNNSRIIILMRKTTCEPPNERDPCHLRIPEMMPMAVCKSGDLKKTHANETRIKVMKEAIILEMRCL